MHRIITRSTSPLLLALLCLLTTDGYAQGQGKTTLTRIVIRAVARDAKIIGDDVGGARITVVNARTGEMLAEGKQEGGSESVVLTRPRPRAGRADRGAGPGVRRR